MSVTIAASPVTATGDISFSIKAEPVYGPIAAVADIPTPGVAREVVSRTIALVGTTNTPEDLDLSLTPAMQYPIVTRTADGATAGKPKWMETEDLLDAVGGFRARRIVMRPGITAPPEPVTSPDGTDYVYSEVE